MSTVPGQEDIIGSETLSIISGAEKFNRWMYEEIKPYLYGSVLELGSGIGNISELVLNDKFKTVLSDYNSAYTDLLTKKFAGYSNLQEVLSIDLQETMFTEKNKSLHEKFDTIFLLNVIEHLQDDLYAVANCHYMLKPGGTLVLLAPAYHFLYCDMDKNLGHYRRYTTQSLAGLLIKNEFAVIQKKYFNLAGIAGWLFLGKFLKKKQLQPGSLRLFNKVVPFIRLADKLILKKIGLSAIVMGKK